MPDRAADLCGGMSVEWAFFQGRHLLGRRSLQSHPGHSKSLCDFASGLRVGDVEIRADQVGEFVDESVVRQVVGVFPLRAIWTI
jgi:hypothetical protein